MTENEAIKILKKTTEHTKVYEDDVVFTSDFVKAYEKAIQSLEEIQQYRAIGTVEELQRQKEYIDTINEVCSDYSAIGTIEEFKALKEKSVAKKMLHNGANWYRCPNGCEIHKKQFEKDWYCPKCGQKLDWSE